MKFKNVIYRYPFIVVFITQVVCLLFIRNLFFYSQLSVTPLLFAIILAIISTAITYFFWKLPNWFLIISLCFPFLFLINYQFLHFSSGVYGVLFLFFALTFSHTLKERVPLYLTNQKTFEALRKIILRERAKTFLDLGSGLGGVVRAVSSDCVQAVGVESAPLLWVVSSLCSLITFKGKIRRKNIWKTHLAEFDVIYAFLSPAIMDQLYKKAQTEMKPGSLLVSNSFEVEGIKPSELWHLDDGRQTKLYFYKM